MKSKKFSSMRRILLLVLVLVMAIAAVPGFADAPTEAYDYKEKDVVILQYKAADDAIAELGMMKPQSGTTCAIDGENVVIHYIPARTTYVGIYMGLISDEGKTAAFSLKDGAFDITLPKSYCGKATPIAPLKGDGGTTSGQCYLAIPAENILLGLADYSAVDAALAKVPADLSKYTDETAKAVQDAVAAVERGLELKDQEKVDAMAKAIEDAVAALKEKPAEEPAEDPMAEKLPYDGSEVGFYKKDLKSAFGMLMPKTDEDKAASTYVVDGDKVLIHISPNNKTTYKGWVWGDIRTVTSGDKVDVAFNEDGTIDLELSKDYCGFAHPIAVVKYKLKNEGDSWTSSDQYYLAIPTEDKLTQAYHFTSGANGKWNLEGEGTLDFVVDGPFDAFKGLTVNGKELAKDNYTAVSGSTKISLKDSYLNTLEVGNYELAASYENGTASTEFTVEEKAAEPEKVENKLNSGEEVKLAPGKYEAVDSEAITEGNKMFRSIQATLTVNEDGSAVLDMYLSGTGYDAIYNGEKLLNMPNGAISKDNKDNLWTGKDLPVSEAAAAEEGTVNGETKLHYQLKFDKLYSWILVGGHSGTYDQWSHKTLNFAADNFKLAEEKSSPKTADFGSQMTIWVVICILSISALICELRRNKYE